MWDGFDVRMTDETASVVNFHLYLLEIRKQTADRKEADYYRFIISTFFTGFFVNPISKAIIRIKEY